MTGRGNEFCLLTNPLWRLSQFASTRDPASLMSILIKFSGQRSGGLVVSCLSSFAGRPKISPPEATCSRFGLDYHRRCASRLVKTTAKTNKNKTSYRIRSGRERLTNRLSCSSHVTRRSVHVALVGGLTSTTLIMIMITYAR